MQRLSQTAIHLEETAMDAMDTFINQQNIKNYRELLDTAIDRDQRRVILTLLADEEEKVRQRELPPYLHPALAGSSEAAGGSEEGVSQSFAI
jgi:hypothetical protein